MPTLYIIQGFIGAGKTTYATALARRTNTVRLNADEWCEAYFPPEKLAKDWDACFAKAVAEQWREADRLLCGGYDVILDFGFWSRIARDHARGEAERLGAQIEHHYLFAPDEVLRARMAERTGPVAERNLRDFHDLKRAFEEPGTDENALVIDTSTDNAPEAGHSLKRSF